MANKKIFFFGFLTLFLYFVGNCCAANGKIREEAFKMIKIELKNTGALCDKLNTTWGQIVLENKKSLKKWTSLSPNKMRLGYNNLLENFGNGIRLAEGIKSGADALCNAFGNLDTGSDPKRTKQLIHEAKVAQNGLQVNVEMAENIMKKNATLKRVGELQGKVGRTLQEKQTRIEELQQKAENLESEEPNTDKQMFEKTMRLVGIYSEIQGNMFSLMRDLTKIYAYMVARGKGLQSEYEDAFGDPMEIMAVADSLVDNTKEMTNWANDLLDLISDFPVDALGGVHSEKYRNAWKNAYDKLYSGE